MRPAALLLILDLTSRLARRGGIQRIRYEIYDDIRGVLKDWLSKVSFPGALPSLNLLSPYKFRFQVLEHICHVVDHGRRKVSTDHRSAISHLFRLLFIVICKMPVKRDKQLTRPLETE